MAKEPTDKGKKPKPKKEVPEEKQMINAVIDYFLKPTMRRSRYLYCGITGLPENCYVMGARPDELVFGNPAEVLTLIWIRDEKIAGLVKKFLAKYKIDTTVVEAIDLAAFVAIVSKLKADDSVEIFHDALNYRFVDLQIESVPPKCISCLVDSLFIFNQFATEAHTGSLYLTPRDDSFDYPLTDMDRKEKLYAVRIPNVDIPNVLRSSFGSTSDIRILLTRGMDWLIGTHLENVTFSGLRIWPFYLPSLRYAYVIETPEAIIMSTRCNVALIPERG